jgi:hypothetical protein
VDQMAYGQNRMVPDHAGSGVAHDLFDPLAHFGFVAVHSAVLAGGFVNTERAQIQPFVGIRPYIGTRLTKRID